MGLAGVATHPLYCSHIAALASYFTLKVWRIELYKRQVHPYRRSPLQFCIRAWPFFMSVFGLCFEVTALLLNHGQIELISPFLMQSRGIAGQNIAADMGAYETCLFSEANEAKYLVRKQCL